MLARLYGADDHPALVRKAATQCTSSGERLTQNLVRLTSTKHSFAASVEIKSNGALTRMEHCLAAKN
jgi:hypothetical protein